MSDYKMELRQMLVNMDMPVNPTKTYKEPKRWKCAKCRDTGMYCFEENGIQYAKECTCECGARLKGFKDSVEDWEGVK